MGCDPSTIHSYSANQLFNMLELIYQDIKEKRGEVVASEIYDSADSILIEYERIGADSCILMDGCMEVLDWLREKRMPLGICTSNSLRAAEYALKAQGISEYFQIIVGRTKEYQIKPDSAQLAKCFDELKIDPRRGLMVGDSHKDIIAGKQLGCFTVGVPVYFTRIDLMKQAGVDVIIDTLVDLKEVIKSLSG
jgi:HAD superfamily hydrolase (TIGR01549 family)